MSGGVRSAARGSHCFLSDLATLCDLLPSKYSQYSTYPVADSKQPGGTVTGSLITQTNLTDRFPARSMYEVQYFYSVQLLQQTPNRRCFDLPQLWRSHRQTLPGYLGI